MPSSTVPSASTLIVFALSPAFEFAHSMSLQAMSVLWVGRADSLEGPGNGAACRVGSAACGAINVVGVLLRDAPFEHPQFVVFSLVVIRLSLIARLESSAIAVRCF
jgi:hypothetical protein